MSDENQDLNQNLEQAENDPTYLDELMENINHERHKMKDRELASKVIIELSKTNPSLLYPKWSTFSENLKGQNAFSKLVAILVITNLVKFDSLNFIDADLHRFLLLLHDESVMIASHCALSCGKIVESKNELEPIITSELLELDTNSYNHKHKELIKAHAIEAFMLYFDISNRKNDILYFVKNQLDSSSGKTKKMARTFLSKFKDN